MRIKPHMRNLDPDEIINAAKDSMFGLGNEGFCVECGAGRGGCEPDAQNYECENCGKRAVFGAEELMMSI